MSDQQPRSGRLVCAACLEDDSLQQFANDHGKTVQCDFCGKTPTTLSVVQVDDVAEFMRKAIQEEWRDPATTAPYCSAEGGYQIKTIDNFELFEAIGFEASNSELMDELLDAFSDHDWCEANWEILSPSRRWSSAWERFERVIKHERRYTFWYSDDDDESPAHPDHLPPSQMLGELQAVINSAKMVKVLPAGTRIWRARLHDGSKHPSVPGDFTSPPVAFATQPNRMSPAGVPMFYGAVDFDTAFKEIVGQNDYGRGKVVSGCEFSILTSFHVLDLTAIPAMPSYFAPEGPFNRHIIRFLRAFTKAISLPIKKDGMQHIDYVPTQVFTEFVRHLMKGPQGVPIHGIKYQSSKNGRECYVIFANAEDCLPIASFRRRPQLLDFVAGSLNTVPV